MMTNEQKIRFAIFFAVVWGALYALLREVLPTGVWGITTGILVVGILPRWLANKIN